MSRDEIAPFPISEGEAVRIATRDIWERIGTFCYPAEPRKHEGLLTFEIWADLPRIYVDPVSGTPQKAHFYRFKNIGETRVSLERGTIKAATGFREAKRAIRDRLEEVDTAVEKAVLQKGAGKLSELPFAAHMHTPLVDILSYLIFHDRIHLSAWITTFSDEEAGLKFTDYVEILARFDLVRRDGDMILPGNMFLGIMERTEEPDEIVRAALRHFFERGISDLESIRRVIGPQLRLSSFVYEAALEWGPDSSIDPGVLLQKLNEVYGGRKGLQFSRYLVQLKQVGLIDITTIGGKRVVRTNREIFESISRSGSLLDPFRRALQSAP